MNQLLDKVTETVAKVLHEDDHVVVRGRYDKYEFIVTIHRKVAGVEHIPRAYMLGSNSAVLAVTR